MKFIIGRKLGMTQMFDEQGNVVPVTLVDGVLCVVTQVKTKERDGYVAYQVGWGKRKNQPKSFAGHVLKAGKEAEHVTSLREFRVEKEEDDVKVGNVLKVDMFAPGDMVKVSGISKGKGFAGVVKRWGFSGLPSSHGTKHEQRKGGSIGSRYPQRVVKGKKMPGRLGGERVTVPHAKIAHVDTEKNILALVGQVPGPKGSFIEIVKE